jgi:hypothetical protein
MNSVDIARSAHLDAADPDRPIKKNHVATKKKTNAIHFVQLTSLFFSPLNHLFNV